MSLLLHRVAEWSAVAASLPRDCVVGLVPTMGALHDGHGALLDRARRQCSVVIATIFVNPIQFNQESDYDLYPRTLEADVAFCASRRIDYVFAPLEREMYPERQRTFVDVELLSDHLCGAYRPGHFRGVATVVLKLFNIFQPHFAYFGEKDYQQLAIVKRLVRDLNVPVQVVGVPITREPDGLAMSSRNRRLSSRERSLAAGLYQALTSARQSVAAGETSAAAIKNRTSTVLRNIPEIRMEYFDLVDVETVLPVEVIDAPVRAAAAIWIGNTRLIDNVLCVPPAPSMCAKLRH
jgi:pantoate--beta-alanine ligase